MMILYQAVSSYHLLSAIIHRMKKHDKDDCVLLLSGWLKSKLPQYKQLENYFKKVILINSGLCCEFTSYEYPESVDAYIKDFLEEEGIDLDDFDEINIWAAHYNLGIYLEHNKIPFVFWEDSSGIVTRKCILASIIENQNNQFKSGYCDREGLLDGTSNCVKRRFFDFEDIF